MHLRGIGIENLRSIRELEWSFDEGAEAGWHVVLGNNGSGKSSVLRAIALGMLTPRDGEALRQDTHRWVRRGAEKFEIRLAMSDASSTNLSSGAKSYERYIAEQSDIRNLKRQIWSEARDESPGEQRYFSSSFGPFRRLGSRHRAKPEVPVAVARHLSLFGENDELVDGLEWLQDLEFRALKARERGTESTEQAALLLPRIRAFVNETGLLPFGARLGDITPDGVQFVDGSGIELAVEELSDGYRSTIGLTFELIRQLAEHYGANAIWSSASEGPPTITAAGIVLIDEVDAHLHPSWQRDIGGWFTSWFPNIQFIVTTHSPLICQAAVRGSILRLPDPGQDELPRVVTGLERERLLFGNVLDALATESFGRVPSRSDAGRRKLERLAELNQKSLREGLDETELDEREHLLEILPTRRDGALDAAE